MHNSKLDLFLPTHLVDPQKHPSWYFDGLLASTRSRDRHYDFPTVHQVFIAHAWSAQKRELGKATKQDEQSQAAQSASSKRERSHSVNSSKSRASSTEGTAAALKKYRIENTPSIASGDDDVVMYEAPPPAPLPPAPLPPKPDLHDIVLYVARAVIQDDVLTLRVKKLAHHSVCRGDSESLRMDRFLTAIRLDEKTEHIFYFKKSEPWMVKDQYDLEAAIVELWNNMDLRVNRTGVDLFVASSEDVMRRIPATHRSK